MTVTLLLSAAACAGTLWLFSFMRSLLRITRAPVWANPILLTAALIAAPLALGTRATGVPLATRFAELTQPLGIVLGVAVVALALPIRRAAPLFRRHGWRLPAVIGGGAMIGSLSAIGCALALRLPTHPTLELSTKSVSSPFAVTIMGELGGSAALAAAVSIITGIIGAVLLPGLLRRMKVTDDLSVGLAIGQAAHVAGTETLLRTRPTAAPFAGLALALAGAMTALALPPLWRWLS